MHMFTRWTKWCILGKASDTQEAMSTLFLIYLQENTDKGRLPPGDQQHYDIKGIKHVKLGPNLKDREYSNSLIQHNVEVL